MYSDTVRCNWCEWQGDEEDLVVGEDGDGYYNGCPKCTGADHYLMDIGEDM